MNIEKLAKEWFSLNDTGLVEVALQFRAVEEPVLVKALGEVAGNLSEDYFHIIQFETLTKQLGKVLVHSDPENFSKGVYNFIKSIDMESDNFKIHFTESRVKETIANTLNDQLRSSNAANLGEKLDYLIKAVTDYTPPSEMPIRKKKTIK